MAIDPRIALAGRGPDVGTAFNNALLTVQRGQLIDQFAEQQPARNRLLDAQVLSAEASAEQVPVRTEALAADVAREKELARITSIVDGAIELAPTIATDDINAVADQLRRRKARLTADGLPTNDTDEALAMLLEPDGLEKLRQTVNSAIQQGKQRGILKAPAGSGGLASAKTEILPDGSVIQSLPTGDVQVRNPAGNVVTGQERTDVLAQAQEAGLGIKQREADIGVRKAERIATATKRADRVSQVTKEMTDRNRLARRGEINLSQAATLVEQAQQGAAGASKVRLAKLFPGIDASNEAALSQSLTLLALDELQKFSGPTTDFEFGKTEEIAGTLGDSQAANRAKIASLRRANWFVQRESKQFQDHVKSGGDPDSFSFNFGEPVKTKKGNFTLRDLQDTAVSLNISIDEAIKRLNK